MITLLTDFGTADYFVGAVKGAILSVNPKAVIADITHEIPPHDIEAGAFTLLASYKTFPVGTIHLAVVDPGVGSTRRPIVVSAADQFFVGPDNGIFSYICDRESSHRTFHITAEKYFRPSPSSTFHGRDIFAPVAAALSNGVKPEELGPEIDDEERLDSLDPVIKNEGKVKARIIHIDRFGNCITNITRDLFEDWENVRLVTKGKTIRDFRNFYGEASKTAPFGIWGSAGFLELSVNGGSAAKALRVKRGDKVVIKD
ncbi:MAG TPA: SAM-dependent chlorinase/fluorinase [Pyrinomonadaceae bacterium]|nr:SAM-dependent chlorinase/fluorinase [Pyrinomonadaceae bacterium]